MANTISIQKELQYRLEFENLITAISTHFINLEPHQFVEGILHGLQEIGNFTGVDRIVLYILDPVIKESAIEWKKDTAPHRRNYSKQKLPNQFSWLINLLEKNKVVNVATPKHLPEEAEKEYQLLMNEQASTFLCLPMFNKNVLSGWMELTTYRSTKNWDDHTIALFMNVANIFINALERKKNEEKIQSLYQTLEEKINEKTIELTTLLNIQKALTTELHVDHVLQLIADEARRLTHTRLSTVYLLENGKLKLKVVSGDREIMLPIGFEIPIEGSLAGIALKTGSPLLVEDAKNTPEIFLEAVKISNIKSMLIIPLLSGRETIGILSVSDKQDGKLGKEDERRLKMFSNISVIALDNARLYQKEQDRREEAEQGRRIAEALRDILRILNSKLALPEVLHYIANQSRELLAASSTMIRKIDYEKNCVFTEASSNLPEDFNVIQELPYYPGGSDRILRENRPVAVSNLNESIGHYLDDPQELSEPQRAWAKVLLKYYQSQLIVPLIINDELYGTLTFYYQNRKEFSEENIHLALTLGTQVSLAIENARLRNQEREIAVAAERNRLARDLHDAVTQTLFSATLIAEVIPRLMEKNPQEGKNRVEELRQLTRGALAEMRTLLLELRPSALKDASFTELLQQLSEALNGRSRIPVNLQIHGDCELPIDVKISIYRITQEALNNIAKHANASEVHIQAKLSPEHIHMKIQDDGKGMDQGEVQSHHLGLGIMNERASSIGARLEIESTTGSGTTIDIDWQKQN